MCGINGAIGNSRKTVEAMNSATRYRGPDDTGVFSDDAFAIGNNRLAIIDLSPLGHQPMTTADGRFSIAFNGEIYNFKEIRAELEGLGVIFKSHSDTEVILEGFAKWGPAITRKLRGMWGLAILDSKEEKLFLARDPFGIKPLYLYDDGETIAFSSEIRGLLANLGIKRIVDHEAIRQIILIGYAIAPRTILAHATSLLPGEEISIDIKTGSKKSEIFEFKADLSTPPSDEELEKILLDSVQKHLIADVPVGLFFSGGIDSTLLAILLKELGVHLNAYHIAIEKREDTAFAEKIAKNLGLNFHSTLLSAPDIKLLQQEAIKVLDEPIADASFLPTLLVSKAAKKDVKVVLSGEGGDELFAGYKHYEKLGEIGFDLSKRTQIPLAGSVLKNVPSFLPLYSKGLIRALERMTGNSLGLYLGEKAVGANLEDSRSLEEEVRVRLSNKNHPDSYLAFDRLMYLPDVNLLKIDTATMSQSIEGRVPFLDKEVWERVAAVSPSWKAENGVGKAPLRRLLKKHLPEELIDRPKTGFSVPVSMLLDQAEQTSEVLTWYKKNFVGLIPALDRVISWGKEKHVPTLTQEIGHSIYAISILKEWLTLHDLSL